jgi:hypothetical protein
MALDPLHLSLMGWLSLRKCDAPHLRAFFSTPSRSRPGGSGQPRRRDLPLPDTPEVTILAPRSSGIPTMTTRERIVDPNSRLNGKALLFPSLRGQLYSPCRQPA